MIEVTASYACGELDIEMKGHAAFSPGKPDIVCAAASAIYYAFAGMIENMETHIADVQKWEERGYARIICRGDNKAKTCLEMAMIGLMQIEKKYPDCVRVAQSGIYE